MKRGQNSTVPGMKTLDRARALTNLDSMSIPERLRAARYLIDNSRPEDESILRKALQQENVSWIINALEKAISNLQPSMEESPADSEDTDLDSDVRNQITSMAVEDTTRLFLHEMEPIVGIMKLSMQKELPEYTTKDSWRHLQRLDSFLNAVQKLGKSARSPRLREFDLQNLIQRIVEEQTTDGSIRIDCVGKQPFVAKGDPDILGIIIRNGIRNAIEALEQSPEGNRKIVISWGDTDIDYWITILDNGPGPPAGYDSFWAAGTTNKKGHIGMGLPISRQAAISHGGTVVLKPAGQTGSVFEIRWPLLRSSTQ